ncbi:hypothetical protein GCM10028814_16700 [Angustibacter aerolatus]
MRRPRRAVLARAWSELEANVTEREGAPRANPRKGVAALRNVTGSHANRPDTAVPTAISSPWARAVTPVTQGVQVAQGATGTARNASTLMVSGAFVADPET